MWWRRLPPADAAHPAWGRPVVLDDFFPDLLTGFRVAEYNAYLDRWPELRVLSAQPRFAACHAQYAARYPQWAARVRPYEPEALAGATLAYLNFLNNGALFLPALQARTLPFVLTLYPGGGFGLDAEDSDAKLRRVLASPLLRALVTTTPLLARYVARFAQREGLRLPPLAEVPGVVVNPLYFDEAPRPFLGEGKDVADVCFVAEKYMPRGLNKGYPEFVAAAQAVAAADASVRFHVVGSFGADDVDLGALAPRLRFHGTLATAELRRFLLGMDAIVAPSRPFTLHAGNFDGFPTGACVEAAACGVAVLAADPLSQNTLFDDGRDLVLVDNEPPAIAAALTSLLREPARLRAIALAGREVVRRHYAPQVQVGRRIAVLERELAAVGRVAVPG